MMIRWRVACGVVMAVAACAPAQVSLSELDTIYATRPARISIEQSGEISRRLQAVIEKQARYLAGKLRPWERDERASLLTAGRSGEADIRPNAHAAYGLACIARTLNDPAARAHSIALLRFLLPTHRAGNAKCADGKQWHSQWQSAHWADGAGKAAWLLWDDLDPQMQWLAARMICDEADRFIDLPPPAQIATDTKAEENAWNSAVISLAYAMFPRHPNHARWGEAAIRWQLSAFATAKDVASDEIIEGKPLKSWLTAPNLHDDYTLENHDRVHPDYMTTIRLNLAQQLTYEWAYPALVAPKSVYFNAEKVYASLKKLALPDGGYIYPNGQDWHLHRAPDWFDAHAMMAVMFGDPQAARLMRICLATAEKMIARGDAGGIYADDETFFASSQGMLLELYCDAWMLLRSAGEGPAPVAEAELWKQLAGAHVFEAGKFAVIRTDHSVASFSWGRQVMGMAFPLRQDLLLTPNDCSLIGDIRTSDGKRDRPAVKQVRTSLRDGMFQACGVLSRADGTVEQRFAFVALPDGRVIWAAGVREQSHSELKSAAFAALGVLNDAHWVYHPEAARTLRWSDGEKTFAAANATGAAPFTASSRWFNIDGLGIVADWNCAAVYNPKPSPIRARTEQIFHLGDATGCHAAIFFPAQDWQQTRDAAAKCDFDRAPDARLFRLTLDDGKKLRIDLDQLTVETP